MKVIFLGPPGAGKGTQAVKVSEKLMVPHISTGDMFRVSISKGTEMGNKAKSYMDKGELVPDEVVIGIVKDRLQMDDVTRGFLLDGFPRTEAQAIALDAALESDGGIDKAIEIDVDDDELVRRIAGRRVCRNCGRNYHQSFNPPAKDGVCDECGSEVYQRIDDNEETVRRRIEVYKKQTLPLIEYYAKKGILISVSGRKAVDEITEDILSLLTN